jgi:hypothetical protein
LSAAKFKGTLREKKSEAETNVLNVSHSSELVIELLNRRE